MMTNEYLRHPGYAEYPVVGVSWIQAVEYANWRTDRVNEMYLEKEGYLARDARYTATADANFNTDTYINAPKQVYGGNEEIVRTDNRNIKTDDEGNGQVVGKTADAGCRQCRITETADHTDIHQVENVLRHHAAHDGHRNRPDGAAPVTIGEQAPGSARHHVTAPRILWSPARQQNVYPATVLPLPAD